VTPTSLCCRELPMEPLLPKSQTNRQKMAERERLHSEAAQAGNDDLLEAMIAACAIIAHADGSVGPTERRRIFKLMRALPNFAAFPAETVETEFARHEQAFSDHPELGRRNALEAIASLKPHAGQTQLLLSACATVLEADGVYHPLEYAELNAIAKILSDA
jgi:tellurite resistance protein